ncbi:MAG: tetratricopeptide repeat protein, partial [Chitinophagaceae bacterium]
MKRKKLYLIFAVSIFICAAVIIYAYTQKQKEKANRSYVLLERKGECANSAEWKEVNNKGKLYLSLLQEDPTDTKTALKLAALYIEEARVTGNHMYYDMAAMKYINNVLELDPQNFHALVFKALIFMSQHHFADGLATAQQAQKINPANAYVYGLLVDGNVEMGNYDSAIANADKMVSIRPDLTSYSRISYLREINGDYAGAIKAMTLAVEAGGAGDEHTEWTRTQLAHLYEKTGDYIHADSLYKFSLSLRPAYPYALAGLGRVALARNDHNTAISHYQKAVSLVDDYTLNEELADIYRLTGKTKEADEILNKIIADMTKEAKASSDDETIGHYSDQELAVAYLKINNLDKALEH